MARAKSKKRKDQERLQRRMSIRDTVNNVLLDNSYVDCERAEKINLHISFDDVKQVLHDRFGESLQRFVPFWLLEGTMGEVLVDSRGQGYLQGPPF